MHATQTQPCESVNEPIAGKYITFFLGAESYGVPVRNVREIVSLVEATPVPQMPEYVKGIINLRGKIIPLVDLRLKLKLSNFETTPRSAMIVVELGESHRTSNRTGLIVDAVQEVLNLTAKDIEATPDFGNALSTEFIRGITHTKGRVITLLNIEAIVTAREIKKITSAAALENAASAAAGL